MGDGLEWRMFPNSDIREHKTQGVRINFATEFSDLLIISICLTNREIARRPNIRLIELSKWNPVRSQSILLRL